MTSVTACLAESDRRILDQLTWTIIDLTAAINSLKFHLENACAKGPKVVLSPSMSSAV